MADRWIQPKEAARMIGVHPKTLKRWRKVRTGPPYNMRGTRFLYLASEVQNWIAGNRVLPT